MTSADLHVVCRVLALTAIGAFALVLGVLFWAFVGHVVMEAFRAVFGA